MSNKNGKARILELGFWIWGNLCSIVAKSFIQKQELQLRCFVGMPFIQKHECIARHVLWEAPCGLAA